MREEVLKLSGKAIDTFLEYDSRKLTAKEIQENKSDLAIYKYHCKTK